jgi:hypothetical protein
MAHSLGCCASFRAVRTAVGRVDPAVCITDIDSLAQVIRERRLSLEAARTNLVAQVKTEADAMLAAATAQVATIEAEHAVRMARARAQQEVAERTAQELRARRSGWLLCLVNRFRAYRCERAGRRAVRSVDQKSKSQTKTAAEDRQRALALLANPMAEADRRLAAERRRLDELEAIATSPEARGAVGEFAVAATLQTLPGDFWVLNDVRLRAERFLRFDGKPVQTAQLDHVVVGPTGVFVIETKSWSRQSASNSGFFDPFEQVGRAGLLLHCLLSDAALPNKVANLIVAHSRMPASPVQGYTREVPPDRLAGYVQTRRPMLSTEEVAAIVKFLRPRIIAW